MTSSRPLDLQLLTNPFLSNPVSDNLKISVILNRAKLRFESLFFDEIRDSSL